MKKPLPRTVEDDHVRTLMSFLGNRGTPEGMRDNAMLRLLSATGMRVGELVMVDVGDVSFDEARVRVVGRGNRERTLPLDRATLDSIRLYLDQARPFLTRNTENETALVVNQRGLRLYFLIDECDSPIVVEHRLKGACAIVGRLACFVPGEEMRTRQPIVIYVARVGYLEVRP